LKEAWNFGGLTFRQLLVRTWKMVDDHEIFTRASAVSFYAMLALVPMLALILAVTVQLLPDLTGRAGYAAGAGNLTVGQLEEALKAALPKEAFSVVMDQIERLQKDSHVGLISVGLVITVWLASSLFVAVIDAMNRIYGVIETRAIWKLRLTAILMTVVEAVILVGSLLVVVAWEWIMNRLGLTGLPASIAGLVLWLVVTVMVLLSFALTFYVGPDADQSWEWITPGSLAGTFVFLIVTLAFRLYVQNFANYNKTYGSLGGVMVLLFWFWLSSVVLLAAGQVNKIIEDASPLGKTYGQKTDPTVAPDFKAMAPEPASS